MNRSATNAIRYVMDEFLPAVVRDNRLFMYPFFYFAYRGKNIRQVMEFKSLVYSFTDEEYARFYNSLDSISRNRPTDLNNPSVQRILTNLVDDADSLLDVGCGHGYLLRVLHRNRPRLSLHGVDVKDQVHAECFHYTKGNVDALPFPDGAFDVVTCCHTLEHLVHMEQALKELKRVAKRQLIIVTPCQRPFYYTLDEHVNFFPFAEKLTSAIGLNEFTCEKVHGDWVYVGSV